MLKFSLIFGLVKCLTTSEELETLLQFPDQGEIEFLEEQYELHRKKDYYKPNLELVTSIYDLEYAVEREILSKEQAVSLWTFLVKRAESTNMAKISEEGFYEAENQENFSVLSIYSTAGIYVILGVFIAIYSFFEKINSAFGALIVCIILSVMSYWGGITLHINEGSGLMASILLLACLHGIERGANALLSILGLSSVANSDEEMNNTVTIGVKIILSIVVIIFTYVLSFEVNFPLVEVPMFFYMTFLVVLVGMVLNELAPLYLQPFWTWVVLVYSLSMAFYIHVEGQTAFVFDFAKNSLEVPGKHIDFRLVAYVTVAIVDTCAIPLILYVNYYKEHSTFKESIFNIEKINDHLNRGNINTILIDEWKQEDGYILLYVLISFAHLTYGFYIKNWAIILTGHLGLCLSNFVIPKTEKYFPDNFIFPLIYIPILCVPVLLGYIEDSYTYQILAYIGNSIIWNSLSTLLRILSTALGLYTLSSSHLLMAKSPVLPENHTGELLYDINGVESIVHFLFRYILTILLIVLNELESSWSIQGVLSLAIVVINFEPLIYTTVTRSDLDKFVVTSVVLLLGMRISLLSLNLWVPYYLGLVMIVISVYRNFQCSHLNFWLYLVAVLFSFVFIFHALCLKTNSALIVSLLVLYYVVGKRMFPNFFNPGLVVFFIVFGVGFWSFDWSFEPFFAAFQDENSEVGKVFLQTMSDPKILIPEKELIERGLKFVINEIVFG